MVISAGFREVGAEGLGREEVLLEIVRRHGMRLVGPNCMGLMNTSPDVRMNATFAPTPPLSTWYSGDTIRKSSPNVWAMTNLLVGMQGKRNTKG